MQSNGKTKTVILGTGWVGFSLARRLDKSKHDVYVVSDRNHYLFTPLLPSTTVGTLEFRAIQEPVRTIPGITYYQAKATELNFDLKQCVCKEVFMQESFSIPYDNLIIATGAQTNTFGVPGVTPDQHVYFLKQLSDARRIRTRLIECFERASNAFCSESERKRLLSFVIVGGGPTSVEFAAELHDFLKADVQKLYPDLHDKISVTLIEATHQILGTFDKTLVDYTTKLFESRKVRILTDNSVTGIKDHRVLLADGTQLPYGLVVWSTGVKPTDLTASLNIEKVRGRIAVDDHLRVPGHSGVYAAGDCAVSVDNPLAPLAQVANQQSRYLAKLLNTPGYDKPFFYKHLGSMAQVGDWQAVVDFSGTPVKKGKLTGLMAFITWRSAYWTRTVSLANKLLIPMYWFKSWLFGRDVGTF